MQLKCPRCKLEWEYTGKKKPKKEYPQYTACSRCKTSVKLEEMK